jgi:copper transport protein
MACKFRRIFFGCTLAVFAALAPTGNVLAHAGLEASEPAASAVLAQSPTEIALFFDEPVDVVFGSIRVINSQGEEVVAGRPQRDSGNRSVARLPLSELSEDAYVVVWRVTSSDSHPVQGSFEFQVGAAVNPNANLAAIAASSATESHGLSALFLVIRWVTYMGIVVLVGACALLGKFERLAISIRTNTVLFGAWLFAFLGTLQSLFAYGPHVSGLKIWEARRLSLVRDALSTHFGQMQLIRLAALVILGVVLRYSAWRLVPWAKYLVLACIVTTIGTVSFSGHAYSQNPRWLSVALDMVHFSAVGVWIGAVILFAIDRVAWLRNEGESAQAVAWFSRMAGFAVPIIVITGVAQAWLMMDGLGNTASTEYGRTLIVKTLLVALVVALGALSRKALRRSGPRSLQQIVSIEAIIVVAVIAITASLVALPPRYASSLEPFSITLVRQDILTNVTVTPARVGGSEIHVIITPPGGSLQQMGSVTARVALPSSNIPSGPLVLEQIGPNHYLSTYRFAFPGTWKLEILVHPKPNTTLLFSTEVEIAD